MLENMVGKGKNAGYHIIMDPLLYLHNVSIPASVIVTDAGRQPAAVDPFPGDKV